MLIYLFILMVAVYFAAKFLGPAMGFNFTLFKRNRSVPSQEESGAKAQIAKLELLLAEKNLGISRLQMEAEALKRHSRDFDKVKTILEEEIQRLREQNHVLKSESGLQLASRQGQM